MPQSRALPDQAGGLDFWSQPDMHIEVQRLLCSIFPGAKVPDIRLDDVFLRTENQFGLYETFTVKALIVKVEFENSCGSRGGA